MDKYIKKLNFDFLTNQRVMQLIAAIDEYRGKWNVVERRAAQRRLQTFVEQSCCHLPRRTAKNNFRHHRTGVGTGRNV
jgi:hypothetical protein